LNQSYCNNLILLCHIFYFYMVSNNILFMQLVFIYPMFSSVQSYAYYSFHPMTYLKSIQSKNHEAWSSWWIIRVWFVCYEHRRTSWFVLLQIMYQNKLFDQLVFMIMFFMFLLNSNLIDSYHILLFVFCFFVIGLGFMSPSFMYY